MPGQAYGDCRRERGFYGPCPDGNRADHRPRVLRGKSAVAGPLSQAGARSSAGTRICVLLPLRSIAIAYRVPGARRL
jgi:hypothetical protein